MKNNVQQLQDQIAAALGVPFVGIVGAGEAEAVMLCALCARELGERAMAAGDEVILVGELCAVQTQVLHAREIKDVFVPADADVGALEQALSPATKAVWVCADAASDTVCTVRNFCNALDLWMLASVAVQDARCCSFEGKSHHVGVVADVAAGEIEDVAFVCTKDTLPYQLMQRSAN